MTTSRRLAAIMAADVVGYSRLMEQDEAATLAALKERRKGILQPLVAQHEGRIVKVMGDGVLVEFASAVNAVQCAVELQNRMAAANAPLPDARHILLRIGINLGDVIIEDGDLYGEGVNIAARLQEFAEPGGVCVTGKVHDEVRRKLDLAFEDAGEQTLKNIAEPLHVYRIAGERGPEPAIRHLPLPDKPSIAVLPFTNMSANPEQQYFSDGITNDLITDLSQFGGLFVIASNSAFAYRGKAVDVRQVSRELGVRYVVQGSVQRESGSVRINAQLIDAVTNAHLWAKRYDREAARLFAIQDELVEAIVTELAVKLDLVERDRAKRKTPGSLSAYDLWLRSRDHLQARTKEDIATARGLLEKAVQLDPNGPRYAADLATAHLYESRWGWSDSPDRSLRIAEELAQKGVALDAADYWTQWVLGAVLHAKADFGGAQAAYERAYALNPNDADLLADFGRFHHYLGRPDEAIRRIESAMRLNPFYPDWYLVSLAFAYFDTGNYQDVIDLVPKARQSNPGLLRLRAAAHIMLGQRDQAEAVRAEVMKLEPWFTISSLRKGLPFKDPAFGEPYFATLRKAGLPE
jgi:TolB-like protein/class 3 adenylate cyclase